MGGCCCSRHRGYLRVLAHRDEIGNASLQRGYHLGVISEGVGGERLPNEQEHRRWDAARACLYVYPLPDG